MCCYAGKLLQQPEMNNPTIVVVTDRNDLDGQLFATFCNAQELLRQTPVQADSREELREELAARQSGGIIFTTVQKFSLVGEEAEAPALEHAQQHRRHQRRGAPQPVRLQGQARHQDRRLRLRLRQAHARRHPQCLVHRLYRHADSQEDKDTRAVFGDYVSIYDIQDAVDDGATVPIYYESRLAKLDINRAEIEELNEEVEEVIEDEEDVTLRERTKSKWAALEKLVGAEPRLKEVAEDLVRHFRGAHGGGRRQGDDRLHEPRDLRPSLQRDRQAEARMARPRPEKGRSRSS
jgi:type I restriction enzyme, R subunit